MTPPPTARTCRDAIIYVLDVDGGWMRTTDIERATGYESSTVARAMTALMHGGAVQRRRVREGSGGGWAWRMAPATCAPRPVPADLPMAWGDALEANLDALLSEVWV